MPVFSSELVVAAGALFMSVVFSASEAAFLLMTPDRYSEASSRKSRTVFALNQLLSRPERMMISILVANTMANGVFVVLSTMILVSGLGPQKGIIAAVVLLTVIVTIFAELFPKVLAGKYPVNVAIWTAYPVYLVFLIITPFASLMEGASHVIYESSVSDEEEILTYAPNDSDTVDDRENLADDTDSSENGAMTEDELRTYLHISRREGVLDEDEEDMIDSVFELSDTFVREVMTPRTEISTIDSTVNLTEAIGAFSESHHSRLLVTEGEKHEVTGVLFFKDILPWLLEEKSEEDFVLVDIVRKARFVPELMKTDTLLQDFQKDQIALAVVIDEHGGTVGVVTIEDLLEEIFGEIIDETDDEQERRITGNGNDGWIIDARLRHEEVFDEIGFDVPEGDFDTIGGFVFHRIGRLPKVGDTVTNGKNTYTVRSMDGRRIETIELYVGDYSTENGDADVSDR